jgi:hypothetical protein
MRLVPFLLALGLAAGAVGVPAVTSPDDGAVTIVAAPAFSGVLRPGQSLRVTGVVTNGAGQTMDAGAATVYLDGSAVSSRAAVMSWLAPDEPAPTRSLGARLADTTIGELAPGQARSFTLTVPSSSIPLSAASLGVFRLAVRLAAGSVELAVARSVVVWTPDGSDPEVELAVATPLVAPPSTTGLLDAAALEALTAPGGALDVQLSTALAHSLAIGVDPMILASIRLLGSSAPPSAVAWLDSLDSADKDVFSLAYADADLPLLRRAGADEPLEPLSFPIDASRFPAQPDETPPPTDLPSPAPVVPTPESLTAVDGTIDGLAWPGDGPLTEDDLDFLSAAGYTRTLVSSAALSGASTTTPDATIGKHAVTVVDDTVSGLLRTAAAAATDADWDSAMAALAGVLATTATDHPGSSLVAALGRDGPAAATRLDDTLDALESLPWVSPVSLTSVLGLPAAKAKLVAADEQSDRVPTAKKLVAAEEAVARFATVVDDPLLVTGPHRLALLGLFSESWSGDTAGWDAAARDFLAESEVIRSSVRIPDSSTINFPLEKGNLPIAVRNELNVPVTVYVRVQPERAILDVLDDRVELKLDANSQAKVLIPVQSIANGEVRTMVSLSSPTGVSISTPTFVVLNVQAGWETAATVVLAVVVVGLFGAGIWRTVLRRRRARARREDATA